MSEQAKQTPLVELLDAVPEDVCIGVQDGEEGHAGTTWHPVGRLCREAAAELRRLHAMTTRRLTDDKIGQIWFAAKIPGLTESDARRLIRAAEEAK